MAPQIRVKVMCIITHNGKLLINRYFDTVKQEWFYRLLGGSVEFAETLEAAIRREMQEELGSVLLNLEYLAMVENVFAFEGKPGHEICFLYKADLERTELHQKELIKIQESSGQVDATWVPITEILAATTPLYPSTDYHKLLQKINLA